MKQALNKKTLTELLVNAGFMEEHIAVGHFEFGANLWAKAKLI